MAKTTQVRSLLKRASALLLDDHPQFVRWVADELVEWINEGLRAIATYVPIAGGRVDAIRLSAGTRQSIAHVPAASVIPGDGSAPADVRGLFLNEVTRNMGSDGVTPGAIVTISSREAIDAFNRMWHTMRPGRGIQHFMFDPRTPQTFYVYPPATDGMWVEVSIIAAPQEVPLPSTPDEYAASGASSAVIDIDDRWANDLLNYVLARAWMKDAEHAGNAANVQMYTQLFINSINAQVQALTGHNPNLKVLPLMPDVPAAAS